jgi:hypothetical protein
MENIEDKVIAKIKKEHIVPTSKSYFKAKNALSWVLFAGLLLISGISIGIITYLSIETDSEILSDLQIPLLQRVVIRTPILWIALLIIFCLLAYLAFHLTRTGYKKSRLYLVGGLALAIGVGGVAYSINIAEKVEGLASDNVPYYRNLVSSKKTIWDNPDKGLIAGEVEKITDPNDFTLKDLKNKVWDVIGNNINYRDKSDFLVGRRVKIKGRLINQDKFEAIEVRPW